MDHAEERRRPKVKDLRHRAQSTLFIIGNEFKDAPESAVLEEASESGSDVDTLEPEAEELMEGMAEWCGLLSETVLGFIWWSLFHGLTPMIWFYPLNELDITGYEVLIVLLLSPLLLLIPPVKRFATSTVGLAIVRATAVLSLASYQAPTTPTRLIVLSTGNAAANIAMFGVLYGGCSARRRLISVWGFLLSHILLLSLRIWWVSLNPVWADNNINLMAIVLGMLAVVEFFYYSSSETKPKEKRKKEQSQEHSQPAWPLVGVGAGSLFFLTHWVFGEVSVVFRWGVSSYPDVGPAPNPWGVIILIASAVGICIVSPTWLPNSYIWWGIGLISGLSLYYTPTYIAVAGGTVLAIYTFSFWPTMIKLMISSSGIQTLTLTFLVYIVHMLAAIWVVAYNFVPIGGTVAREQTGPLMAAVLIGVGLPLLLHQKTEEVDKKGGRGKDKDNGKDPATKKAFPHGMKTVLLLFVAIGLVGMGNRYHHKHHINSKSDHPREFTSMIWTIHFGYDNYGWPSFEQIAALINNTEADVIGLLETDASRPFLHNHDITMWLEERLGLYADFGPATRGHTWGSMLLSKHPIVKSKHHLLPSPQGELAPAISATVNIRGNAVDFLVVHMGNDGDDLDRQLQAEELANILTNFENPAVFLGYVTSAPGSRDYMKLLSGEGMKDIDASDRNRWCQYIFYKKLIRLGYARISHSGLSDTEAQLAKFRIQESPDEPDHGRITTQPDDVQEYLHFPSIFGTYYEPSYKKWDMHHYQDGTPKYFIP